MSLTPRFKEKQEIYYVDVPAREVIDSSGNRKMVPQRPIVVSAIVMGSIYPNPPFNELYYILHNDKRMNDKALYGTRFDAEAEAERLRKEFADAEAGLFKKQNAEDAVIAARKAEAESAQAVIAEKAKAIDLPPVAEMQKMEASHKKEMAKKA